MKHGSFTGVHKSNQINHITSNPKKTFILRKLAKIEDKADILTKIERSLNNENNFLEMNSEILIGKRNHGPVYDDNQEPIPYTYVGPAASLKPKKIVFRMSMPSQRIKGISLSPKTLSSSSLGSSKNTFNKTTNNSINIKKQKIQYEVVDEKILKQYYQNIKSNEEEILKKDNKSLLQSLPKIVKRSLQEQEKNLDLRLKDENSFNNLSSFLSKRSHKKESDLLINRIDSFRLKKQFIDSFHHRTKSEVYANNRWLFELRRPDNFTGIRETFVNIRSDSNPFWVSVREKVPGNNELVRKPRLKSYDCYESYINNPSMKNNLIKSQSMKEIDSLNNLEIKGTSLLDFEAENEAKIPGKKIMYKRNQLDTLAFISNQVEYDKNCKKILSDKLFAENYNKY